jgi:isochorismatase family protein
VELGSAPAHRLQAVEGQPLGILHAGEILGSFTPARYRLRTDCDREAVTATPEAGDLILNKHRYSGFYENELDDILKSRSIKNLIFTGCTTSVCVESTIRDAMFRDFTCLLLADCTAEPIGYGLARSNAMPPC